MKIRAWIQQLLTALVHDNFPLQFNSPRANAAIKTAIATPLATWIAWLLQLQDPGWAGMSAFVVMQITSGATLTKGLDRIVSTIIAVFIALLVVTIFIDNLFWLLLTAFFVIALGLYYSRKTDKLYAWLLGLATFAMIIFGSSGMTPTQITNMAYYRGTEIILGTLCTMLIALIKPVHLQESVQAANQKLIDALQEIYTTTLACYRDGVRDENYMQKIRELSLLADQQTQTRRIVEQEIFFKLSANKPAFLIEQTIHASYEVLADIYHRYQTKYAGLGFLFKEPLAKLEAAFIESFIALKKFLGGEITCETFQQSLQKIELSLDALIVAYQQAREQKQVIKKFNLPSLLQWQQFIIAQQNLVTLLKNFSEPLPRSQKYLSWWGRLRHFTRFEHYHLMHGIKSAAAIVVLGFSVIYIDLSPAIAAMTAAIIIISIQLDAQSSAQFSFLITFGLLLGTVIATIILVLSISNLWLYLLVIAIAMFFAAYAIQGALAYNYFGAGFGVAIVMGTLYGIAPVTDWRPQVLMLLSVLVALIIFLIYAGWVWPFGPRDKIRHEILQLNRYRYLLQQQLLNGVLQHHQFDFVLDRMIRLDLNTMRQHLRAFAILDLAPELKTRVEPAVNAWRRCYFTLSNLMLATQRLVLPPEVTAQLPVLQLANDILDFSAALETRQAAQQTIRKWLIQLRLKTLYGKQDLLPIQVLLSTINFLVFLDALAQELQEIEHQQLTIKNLQ